MAKRFRARVFVWVESKDEIRSVTFQPTRDRALKDGIEIALTQGLIVVEEVEVEQKVKREWVEKE